MHLPRFRLRTLMVIVAAVGVPIAIVGRGVHFAHQAESHWQTARAYDARAGFGLLTHGDRGDEAYYAAIDRLPDYSRDQKRAAKFSHYHGRIAMNYHWAARYPWLPVEPDPPEPE
jgi:hypothetical protein